jgi:hypothetical protein
MEFNNAIYFNKQAFESKSSIHYCYIPENADSITDCYTYADLLKAVLEWQVDNKDYFVDNDTTPKNLTKSMFSELSGEFPETYLNDLIND